MGSMPVMAVGSVRMGGLNADFWATNGKNLLLALVAIGAFIAVVALLLWGTELFSRLFSDKWRGGIQLFTLVSPVLILLAIGLIWPAVQTFFLSFTNVVRIPDPATGINVDQSTFVWFKNYIFAFSDPTELRTVINTLVWMFVTPILSTLVGLAYAVFIDRAKGERTLKSLVFLPVAVSLVGASIVWGFIMYDFNQTGSQTGIINALIALAGGHPINFLTADPWNTIFLIMILVWTQTGFAMVVLSAAIKGVPVELNEASALDGANAWQRFWQITVPSIRGTLVVVLTTITIATLKVFDVVRTLTQGRNGTNVIAYDMYDQFFVKDNRPLGAALAVVMFIFVVPIVVYNVRSMRKVRENH